MDGIALYRELLTLVTMDACSLIQGFSGSDMDDGAC
jgi:hypothetical protein